MIDAQKSQDNRWISFARWWNRNHHRQKSHDWLCAHARRIAFAYFFHPAAFDEVIFITKRHYNSEYKRLKQADAWKLWRFIHPLHNRRVRAIEAAADRYEEKRQKLKELKDSLPEKSDKPAEPAKKTVIVVERKKRVINRPSTT